MLVVRQRRRFVRRFTPIAKELFMHPEPKFNVVSIPEQTGLSGVQEPGLFDADPRTSAESTSQRDPVKPWLLDSAPGIRTQGSLPSKPQEPDTPNPMPHPPGDEQPKDPRIPEEAPPLNPPSPVREPQGKAA
jgi:hypothetical protein